MAITIIAATMIVTGCTGTKKPPAPFAKPTAAENTTLPYQDLKKEWSTMTMDRYVERIAQQAKTTWSQLDKIWPGVDFGSYQVAIRSGSDAWLIKAKSGELSKIDIKDLPEDYQLYPGLYLPPDAGKMNDVPTMLLTIDPDLFKKPYDEGEFESIPTSNVSFMALTHETFHHSQERWSYDREEASTERSTIYPINVEARQMRLEIIHHLREAVLQPEMELSHIQAARWTYDQMIEKQKDEYDRIRMYDLLEGTARFFDMSANARAALGWKASPAEMDDIFRKMMKIDYHLGRYDGQSDSESYEIGGPAGILLERQGNMTWKKDAEKGIPPLESLLKSAKPVEMKTPQSVKDILDKKVAQPSEVIKPGMESLKKVIESKNVSFIIPGNATDYEVPESSGGFSYPSIKLDSKFSNLTFFPRISSVTTLQNGKITLKNSGFISGELKLPEFKEQPYVSMIPLPKEAKISDKRIEVNTDSMQVSVNITKVVKKAGHTFYVVD
ncbi:hypothetical protein NV379_08540 [Paenibacillus sp. N1-5-1-14]|uniref:hypothetical protein n=1 Tax=Paenibacillus radicibacter TaxID=2972488 RepID=UPI0021593BDA|nr:hypothetical protein [Paenibacillus radicibacter]MCR8642709.1 hypothetical protein [Paenibacillus radicibacter]